MEVVGKKEEEKKKCSASERTLVRARAIEDVFLFALFFLLFLTCLSLSLLQYAGNNQNDERLTERNLHYSDNKQERQREEEEYRIDSQRKEKKRNYSFFYSIST